MAGDDGLAEGGGGGAEVIAGEACGDECVRALLSVGIKETAGDGLNTENLHELWAGHGDGNVERCAVDLDAFEVVVIDRGGLERVDFAGEVGVVATAEAGDGTVFVNEVGLQGDDAVGVVVAEGLEQDVVDDGEDGGVEADADGERGDDGEGEGGAEAEAA